VELFGPHVQAASVPAELTELGARLPRTLRMGTSSWSFPGWQGLVWRHAAEAGTLAREGLSAYAQHPLLRAVGVDRTYYGPVSAEVFGAYAAQVPLDFRFLVKAHDHLTLPRLPDHPRYGERAGQDNPRFLDPSYARDAVIAPAVEGLGARLGTLLFQVPPTPAHAAGGPERFAERLHAFLRALPRGPHYAVEIRTPAFLTAAYAQALVQTETSHSYVVHPRMPPIDEQIRRVPGGARHGLVIRWMLRRDLGYEAAKARFSPFRELAAPDESTRDQLARLIGLALGRDKEVVVIINNKAEGSAPRSVTELARAIDARRGSLGR